MTILQVLPLFGMGPGLKRAERIAGLVILAKKACFPQWYRRQTEAAPLSETPEMNKGLCVSTQAFTLLR